MKVTINLSPNHQSVAAVALNKIIQNKTVYSRIIHNMFKAHSSIKLFFTGAHKLMC